MTGIQRPRPGVGYGAPAPDRDPTVRLLLVEDDEAHAELIRRNLEPRVETIDLTIARTLRAARTILASNLPDLIITDWRLPDGSGLDLLGSDVPDCPIIVMTGHGDERTAVNAMKAGAVDYVVKSDAAFTEMPRIVERAIRSWGHIVERRRAEKALADSEAHYRALIENALDIVTVVDEAGFVQYTSPAMTRVLGYTPEERLGKHAYEHVHPDDREEVQAAFAAAFDNPGVPECLLFRFRHRDGTWRTLESVGMVHRSRDGQLRGVINSRDVTEREKAEAERKRLEDQLFHTQRLEAIGKLAGGIAHDFNNLLTIIGGHVDLLQEEARVSRRGEESVAEIRRAHESAITLTRQLLAFGRQQVLEPIVLDPNRVLVHVQQMVRRVIGENIELTSDFDDAAGFVKADPGQLEQVIVNLLVNARDALPHGGTISLASYGVELSAVEVNHGVTIPPGRYVVLAVSDDGVGMDEETRSQVFDPFFTTKPRGKGTGLGLSTVFGIVQQSNGHIVVESTPGQGSTLSVFFPQVDPPEKLSGHDEAAPGQLHGTETVLVVEDNEAVRGLMAKVLRSAGFTLFEADAASDAMRIADEHPGEIDLLLTDLIMPGSSGMELATAIREKYPKTTVLYTSGYADDTLSAERAPGEPFHFLPKPFTPNDLVRKARETIDQSAEKTTAVPPR